MNLSTVWVLWAEKTASTLLIENADFTSLISFKLGCEVGPSLQYMTHLPQILWSPVDHSSRECGAGVLQLECPGLQVTGQSNIQHPQLHLSKLQVSVFGQSSSGSSRRTDLQHGIELCYVHNLHTGDCDLYQYPSVNSFSVKQTEWIPQLKILADLPKENLLRS